MKKNKFDNVDVSCICIYLLGSLFLYLSYHYALFSVDKVKLWIYLSYFFVQFALFGLFFRKLRNDKLYLCWCFFGLLQLLVFFLLKDNSVFFNRGGSDLNSLRGLLPSLIVYQILRKIYYKIYKQELIISMSMGRMSFFEEEDNRNMNFLDVAFSLIMYGVICFFSFLL